MSRAFVKESDDEPWLNEIAPTVNALIKHLTRENGNRKVFEKNIYVNENDKEIHVMSNGLSYMLNEHKQWQVVL